MLHIETLADHRFEIRSRFGLLARLLGLTFIGLGCWIGLSPIFLSCIDWVLGRMTTSALIECVPGMLIGMLIGVPMLCIGWVMALLRHRVEINLAEKRVTAVSDFLVWKVRKSYLFTEIKSVLLNSTSQRGKDTTRYYVHALITTRTENVTVVSEPASREEDVRDIAKQLAGLLGVMVVDEISDD